MASNPHLLAIDQGTTNTKVLLIASDGHVAARASRPLSIRFPQPGWVEQDALELWNSVREAADECLARVPGAPVAIGISNQRESVLIWDRKTGQPAGPCITWQCRRTAPFCAGLRARGLDATIRERTGLALDPLFSASKARWLLDQVEDGAARARRGELGFGNVDSWLLWNLTGGAVHATDATNASRTQLLNLKEVRWDPELLEIYGIPAAMLPEVRDSSGIFGHTVALGHLPAGIPVGSLIGDSHAALFGHAVFQPGAAKATYGTGSSLMTLTDGPVRSERGLSSTIAWSIGGRVQYALEGNITVTGGAIQWLGDFLGLKDPVAGVAELAETVPAADGVYLVPAFAGLGAPYWDADARGLVSGLTRGTTAAHLARATIESVAYQVRDVFLAMEADGNLNLPVLLADGGASRNRTLMQFQSDILNRPVVPSDSADLSACGAGWLAGLATGFWPSLDALAALKAEGERFNPNPDRDRFQELCKGWETAVRRTRTT